MSAKIKNKGEKMNEIESLLRTKIRIIATENAKLRAKIKSMEETREALIIEAREQIDELTEENEKLKDFHNIESQRLNKKIILLKEDLARYKKGKDK